MSCPECNSENVIEGMLSGYCGVTFIKKGTENKLRPEAYKVKCLACCDCGKLFDFRIVLKQKKR